MAGFIPKENLDNFRRWQAESFDAPAAKPAVETPRETVPVAVEDVPADNLVANLGLPTAEDIERMHNEARAAGFEEGRQAGYAEGRAAIQAEAEHMASLAANFEQSLTALDQNIADHVLALAVELAGQVLRRTLEADTDALLPVVREALAALPVHHGHVALHVHPGDAEAMQHHFGPHFSQAGWHIVQDSQIQPGGCYLKAGSSEVDATLATRWKRVLEAIGIDTEQLPD